MKGYLIALCALIYAWIKPVEIRLVKHDVIVERLVKQECPKIPIPNVVFVDKADCDSCPTCPDLYCSWSDCAKFCDN